MTTSSRSTTKTRMHTHITTILEYFFSLQPSIVSLFFCSFLLSFACHPFFVHHLLFFLSVLSPTFTCFHLSYLVLPSIPQAHSTNPFTFAPGIQDQGRLVFSPPLLGSILPTFLCRPTTHNNTNTLSAFCPFYVWVLGTCNDVWLIVIAQAEKHWVMVRVSHHSFSWFLVKQARMSSLIWIWISFCQDWWTGYSWSSGEGRRKEGVNCFAVFSSALSFHAHFLIRCLSTDASWLHTGPRQRLGTCFVILAVLQIIHLPFLCSCLKWMDIICVMKCFMGVQKIIHNNRLEPVVSRFHAII